MTRQNALDPQSPLSKDANGLVSPLAVVDTIPTAKQVKQNGKGERKRNWDEANPTSSYRVPSDLYLLARDIQEFISDVSTEKMTSASTVANAMMTFALGNVREGKLTIEARPKPDRRKMALVMIEVNEWPHEPKKSSAKKNPSKAKTPSLVLSYRWSAENNRQIRAIAGGAISEGELVVFLLNYAWSGYRTGVLQFKETPITTSQIVSAAW